MAREHPTEKQLLRAAWGDAPRNLGGVCLRHVVAAAGAGRNRGVHEVITVRMAVATGMVIPTC